MKDNLLKESSESESSEEEDEDAKELTEDVEKTFFKTLSYIKRKDPKIYDENVKFFSKDESEKLKDENKSKKKKETPLNLRAYERKLILERGGELSDEEQEFVEEGRSQSPTYTEEQKALKESFKKVLSDDSDNEGESWGGLFRKRDKTLQEVKNEDEEYREWLKGQKNELADKEVEKDLKYLHDYWTDPKLDEGEQFLRDYILNKRFLDKEDEPEMDINKLLEEEKELEEQTEFEHKYNYRFEEPDQEFIKRYPRVMANSLRVKDERRKEKREEVKERKMKEKEKKKEEIRKKKKMKKQEIEEKLEELKKLTGNDQLAFESQLNNDFDQDEYDRIMKKLFNEEFYSQDDPSFNPKDAMGEEYDGLLEGEDFANIEEDYEELNCEDPNFVMDCDYDPTIVPKKNKKEGKGRRARDKHRRTTVSEAVNREKPVFDPMQHVSYQDYLDQYYGIDCEDFIGDIPCRFKYKRVPANSYGLSVEEILAADDKELERWCSMKRVHKVAPEYKERNDAKMYSKKAKNDELKKKILPSLYSETTENDVDEEVKKKKKKKKKKKRSLNDDSAANSLETEETNIVYENETVKLANENVTEDFNQTEKVVENQKVKKKKSKKDKHVNNESNNIEEKQIEHNLANTKLAENPSGNEELLVNEIVKKKNRSKHTKREQKLNRREETQTENNNVIDQDDADVLSNQNEKKRKRKDKAKRKDSDMQNKSCKKIKVDNVVSSTSNTTSKTENSVKLKKKKKQNISKLNSHGIDITAEGKTRRQKRNAKIALLKTKLKQKYKYKETLKIADKYEKKLLKPDTLKSKRNIFKGKKSDSNISISDSRLKAYGIKPKFFKDKLKYGTQFSMFSDQ